MSNLVRYTLPYLDHYDAFVDLPGFVLLESCDQRYGRYDIVTALPYDTVHITRSTVDMDAALTRLQAKMLCHPCDDVVPFPGGAIGYVSYDFGAILSGIVSVPHPLLADLPLLEFKFYDWALIADHHTRTMQLVSMQTQPETERIVPELIARWHSAGRSAGSYRLTRPFKPLISLSEYRSAFQQIHADIQNGRTYQVNYTQPFLAEYEGDAWSMYRHISRANPVPFSAFLTSQSANILCFSPERYLKYSHHQLLASPIKGSAKRSTCFQTDLHLKHALTVSEKNRAENIMIVDLWRHDLSRLCLPGTVRVNALCEAMSFESVHHLVSHIEGECPDRHPLEAILACFPAGSITGAPKLETMKLIQEQERYARGIYCGAIGYVSTTGRSEFNIAIRTMVAKADQLYLGVGGGVVMDSDWVSEYQECHTKIQGILKGLRRGSKSAS